MKQTLLGQIRSQVARLHTPLDQLQANPSKIARHPKKSPIIGRKLRRSFSIFATCLLVESVILQILTSTPIQSPQYLAQEAPSTGQVVTDQTQPTATAASNTPKPIINNQVQAATVKPTPQSTPTPFTSPLRHYTLTQYYSNYHPAIDMAAPYGSPVYSINQGTVVGTGYILAGGGLMVKVQHRNGYYSYYAHLSSIQVSQGQSVNSQTILGRIGTTGWSTGPHLHLIIEQNIRYLNPLAIIR